MSLFSDPKNKIIDNKYIEELKDCVIPVEVDTIEKAKQGNAEAMYKIGCHHATLHNENMATVWLGASAALGFFESQLKLGDLFIERNPECASAWYELAVSNGVKRAGVRTGDILLEKRQYGQAEMEYINAAESGDPYCQNYLGVFYRDGYYTRRGYNRGVDYEEAFKWFQMAADQNYAEAQYNVAQLYENGQGVGKNKYTALHWYERSKAGGYKNVDKCIEILNKEGYFYFPRVENVSSLATTTEAEAPKSTADVRRRVELSELKKKLRSLQSFDSWTNSVNVDNLMDMFSSMTITVKK